MSRSAVDKRESRIRAMFGNIAPRYDLLNHLLSLNIDRWWRTRTTRLAPPILDGSPILDVCTGTGDLAFAYDTAAKGTLPVVGADFCLPMLERAKQKADQRNASGRVGFVEADTQRLPFPDGMFQLVTVAFGLRNVTDTDLGLAEMVRVARPGGRVAILEFSKPRSFVFGGLYRFYFRQVLPRVGQMVSKSKDQAYDYLPRSVLEFPDGEAMVRKLEAHGLTEVTYHPMTFGIATLYVGKKGERGT